MSRLAWPSLIALALLVRPTHASTDAIAEFKAYAMRTAAAQKRQVCGWGSVAYDARENPGYFAALGDESGQHQIIVLSVAGKQTVYDLDETWNLALGCTPSETPWETLQSLALSAAGGASYRFWTTEVSVIASEWVVLRDRYSDIEGSVVNDWAGASRTTLPPSDTSGEDAPSEQQEAGLLIALPPGPSNAASAHPPTFVSTGGKQREDRADADLSVHSTLLDANTVRLEVDVQDDHFVPVQTNATDKRFLRGDHLELWWAPAWSPAHGKQQLRQLGIGLLASGGVDVRWLHGAKPTPLPPEVRRSQQHLEIDLPISLLSVKYPNAGDTQNWSVPFTIAFSDADDASGQQTIVATSELRWNDADALGELAHFSTRCGSFPGL